MFSTQNSAAFEELFLIDKKLRSYDSEDHGVALDMLPLFLQKHAENHKVLSDALTRMLDFFVNKAHIKQKILVTNMIKDHRNFWNCKNKSSIDDCIKKLCVLWRDDFLSIINEARRMGNSEEHNDFTDELLILDIISSLDAVANDNAEACYRITLALHSHHPELVEKAIVVIEGFFKYSSKLLPTIVFRLCEIAKFGTEKIAGKIREFCLHAKEHPSIIDFVYEALVEVDSVDERTIEIATELAISSLSLAERHFDFLVSNHPLSQPMMKRFKESYADHNYPSDSKPYSSPHQS